MSNRVCRHKFQCGGNCWFNVAGNLNIWKIISKHCHGTLEEQEVLDDAFNNKIDRSEVIKKFDFTDEEKQTLKNYWNI